MVPGYLADRYRPRIDNLGAAVAWTVHRLRRKPLRFVPQWTERC